MTISSESRKAGPFIGNDVAVAFPFAFKVFTTADLQVVRQLVATGTESALTLTTDYTVALNADQNANPGGTVTLLAPLATGYTLTIASSLQYLQPTDLTNQGGFYPAVITNALDRLTIFTQQIVEAAARTMKFPISETGGAVTLPAVDQRKGKFLYFDSDSGAPVVTDTVVDLFSVIPASRQVAYRYVATSGQTTFNGTDTNGHALSYSVGYVDVYQNGLRLDRTQFTATDGLSIVLATGATTGDKINVLAFATFSLANITGTDIAFAQTGTGSIQRTLLDKVRELHVSPEDFGAVGDGVADDGPAFRLAEAAIRLAGAGGIKCAAKKTYRLVAGGTPIHSNEYGLVLRDNTKLDLNGSRLNCEVGTGNQLTVWVYGNNVEIDLAGGGIYGVSSGSPSSQFFYHAGVSVGVQNNCGDSVASPSPGNFVHSLKLHGGTLHTTRPGAPVVQMAGGVNNVRIYDINIPDSSTCTGVHGDWGNVGPVDTNADPLRIINTRATYDAGLMYTTHPNNISIKNVKAGKLTHSDAHLIRLSSCFNVTVENCSAEEIGYSAYTYVGGDLGSEFSRDGRVAHGGVNERPMVHRGNKVTNVTAKRSNYHGVFIDTFGDNIAKAVIPGPYTPIEDPWYLGGIEISGCVLTGNGTSGVGNGLHVQDTNGGVVFRKNVVTGFAFGGYCDTDISLAAGVTKGVTYEKNTVYGNRKDGIATRDIGTRMADIYLIENKIFGNGTDGGYGAAAGISFHGGTRLRAIGNLLGAVSEATQDRGVLSNSACTQVEIVGNHVLGVQSGGFAYGTSNSTDYAVYKVFKDNSCVSGITYLSGCNLLPFEQQLSLDSRVIRHLTGAKASLTGDTTPTAGAWVKGDAIFFDDIVAGGKEGSICVTSGSPGTWKQFGAVSA